MRNKREKSAKPSVLFSGKDGIRYGKRNYMMLLCSVLVLSAGFITMAGDSEPYGYGMPGLTVGPSLVFTGLILPFFSIFIKQN